MNQNQYGQQGPLMNQPLTGSQIIYQQQMITPGEDKNQQMIGSQNNIQNNSFQQSHLNNSMQNINPQNLAASSPANQAF